MITDIEVREACFPKEVKVVRIPEQKVFDGIPFPLVLNPADDFIHKDADFWNEWIKENVAGIEKILLKYGAILFRNFPLDKPQHFDEFSKAFGYKEFPYVGGMAVRTYIVGNVWTANEAPLGTPVPFHHEMAHVRDYPLVLFFYCDVAAKEGGETPMLLSNVVYRRMAELQPELVDRLEKGALRYVRVAPAENDFTSQIGRSWKSTFLTDDREEAENKARSAGYDIEWQEDGSMKTITHPLPPIRLDKRTGKKMWFNTSIGAISAWTDSRNHHTQAVVFADGTPVPIESLAVLEKVVEEAGVAVKWQRTDVVMLDNRAVQHARADHFVPPRRILASLFTDHQGVLSFLE